MEKIIRFVCSDPKFGKFKVYVYCDPRYLGNYVFEFNGGVLRLKYKPFYIGCAGYNNHLRHFYKGTVRGEYIQRRIKVIRGKKLEPIVKILRIYESRKKAHELEERLIISVGRQDLKTGPLLNRADGGLGLKNPNEDYRKKRGEISRNINLRQWKNPEYRKKMGEKFREAWNRPEYKVSRSGENNGRAKLTRRDVLKIREDYKKKNIFQHELAKKYNVVQSCIWQIVRRKTWTHI